MDFELRRRAQLPSTRILANSDGRSSMGSKRDLNKIANISYVHWWILVLIVATVYTGSIYLDGYALPDVVPGTASRDVFSEERCRACLNTITAFGPRVTGSYANEIQAASFIVEQLSKLRDMANQSQFKLLLDESVVSDCFPMFLVGSFHSCYRNVKNIAAKLTSSVKSETSHSLLVNCHFDTALESPGASDDAVSCCLMLEMISVLIEKNLPIEHDIIFLFNGAEENFLQAANLDEWCWYHLKTSVGALIGILMLTIFFINIGIYFSTLPGHCEGVASHGFIKQHPWRHSIRAFVNLEAAGSGGREILFQAGPGNPWLVKTYLLNAPYPHATIMAQELFESGHFPGDTDFRIFRDHGRIPGLDIAFTRNGYIYHSEFDTADRITLGSIQRAGENVLVTVIALANSTFLSQPGDYEDLQGRWVYFDILGLFVVHYPHWLGQILNFSVVLAVIVNTLYKWKKGMFHLKTITVCLLAHVASVIAICGAIFMCIQVVTNLNLIMAWYSKPYWIIFLYILPGVFAGLLTHSVVASMLIRSKTDIWSLETCSHDTGLYMFTLVLAVLTFMDIGSAYYICAWVAFPSLRDVLRKFFRKDDWNTWSFFLCHTISLFVPLLFCCYFLLENYAVLIPVMGRVGTKLNPEYMMGALAAIAAIGSSAFLGSLIYVTKRPMRLCAGILMASLVAYFSCALSSCSVPYKFSENIPMLKRVIIHHSTRKSFDMENGLVERHSGLWVVPLDYRGVSDLPQNAFAGPLKPASDYCLINDRFCGFSYYLPAEDLIFVGSKWVPTVEPVVEHPIKWKVLQKNWINSGTVNVSVMIEGSDHVTVFVTPEASWRLVAWFPMKGGIGPEESQFIYLSDGQQPRPWLMWYLFKASKKVDKAEPVCTFTVTSHILHGNGQKSDMLAKFEALVRENRPKAQSRDWLIDPQGYVADVRVQKV